MIEHQEWTEEDNSRFKAKMNNAMYVLSEERKLDTPSAILFVDFKKGILLDKQEVETEKPKGFFYFT